MNFLIVLGSRPGDVILDITCGSGTTCVAAAMLDRHYIGIEADADYAAIARARVAAVKKAQSAKSAAAPKPAAKKTTARSGKATSKRSKSSTSRAPRKPAESSAARPADARRSQPSAPGRLTAGELFAGVGGFRLGLGRSGWDTVFSNQWEPGTATQHASECLCPQLRRRGAPQRGHHDAARQGPGRHDHHPRADAALWWHRLVSTIASPSRCPTRRGSRARRVSSGGRSSGSWSIAVPRSCCWRTWTGCSSHPRKQRGRDFAVIVRSLTDLGYTVEWRVVNAADYGFAQRRRRVFIVATDTRVLPVPRKLDAAALIGRDGVLARALPVAPIEEDALSTFSIDGTLEEVGRCFGAGLKRSPFLDAGFAVGHLVRCCTPTPDYHGPVATLGSVLLDERLVPKRFFIDRNKLPSWRYLKGAKRLNRTRPDGSGYVYTEGAVAFPDAANRASRTLLTSEGSSSASRTTHVVKCGNRRHRRLTPVELERLNGFPDEWTKLRGEGVENSDVRRGFLMGNALVVGLVERIGEVLAADWKARVATAPVPPTVPMPLNSIAQEQAAPYGTYTPVEERRAA